MNHSVYPVERDGEELVFFFTSTDMSGTNPVDKMVKYDKIVKHSVMYFNLAFGDYNKSTGDFNDMVVTDNGDMRKVFRTVISTLEVFFNEHAEEQVHIDGSDSTRKAYYHKLIRDHFELILTQYEVYGSINGNKESFQPNKKYDFITVGIR